MTIDDDPPPIDGVHEDHPVKRLGDEFLMRISDLNRDSQFDLLAYLIACMCRHHDVSIEKIANAARAYAEFDQN